MAIAGLGNALGIIGQGIQQKAQVDWQEQRQANLERIRAEERGQDRAERTAERDEARTERKAEFEANAQFRKDSLLMQATRDKASEKADAARLGIAQEGLRLQKKSADYQMFSQAISGASGTFATLKQKEAEILSQQPRVNKDGEQVEDMASFKARNAEALRQVRDAIKVEQPKFQKELERVRKNFPQFENLMPSIEEMVQPEASKVETERQAFLRSPEEVAKRKAAQASADAGTAQPSRPLIERAASGPASQDQRWIARQEEIKRLGEAKAAKAAEEKRLQDEENYRILEARRLGRGSDMPAKPVFSSNGFDRRY